MLRCLARLCPLARSLSAKGVQTLLFFSHVAGYGCTCSLCCVAEWYDAAVSGAMVPSLAANCVHTLLCTSVAGYGCIRSLCHALAANVSDTRLRRLVRLCSLPLRFACTRPCVLAYQVRFGIRLYSLYSPLTAVSRVRRCNVLRSCIHSLCGLRALTVVHWKGGGFRLSC